VFIFFNETTEHWGKKKNDKRTVLYGEEKHRTENNHPQNTGGKRLPKYDSQSETTNDTCL
jgi:hypothetical protein